MRPALLSDSFLCRQAVVSLATQSQFHGCVCIVQQEHALKLFKTPLQVLSIILGDSPSADSSVINASFPATDVKDIAEWMRIIASRADQVICWYLIPRKAAF